MIRDTLYLGVIDRTSDKSTRSYPKRFFLYAFIFTS